MHQINIQELLIDWFKPESNDSIFLEIIELYFCGSCLQGGRLYFFFDRITCHLPIKGWSLFLQTRESSPACYCFDQPGTARGTLLEFWPRSLGGWQLLPWFLGGWSCHIESSASLLKRSWDYTERGAQPSPVFQPPPSGDQAYENSILNHPEQLSF